MASVVPRSRPCSFRRWLLKAGLLYVCSHFGGIWGAEQGADRNTSQSATTCHVVPHPAQKRQQHSHQDQFSGKPRAHTLVTCNPSSSSTMSASAPARSTPFLNSTP